MAGKAELFQFGRGCLYRLTVYPYTDYTDYTPYTRYTANPGKTTGNRIPAWLIRKIYKRTRPHIADPTVYSCGMRWMRAAMGRILHMALLFLAP